MDPLLPTKVLFAIGMPPLIILVGGICKGLIGSGKSKPEHFYFGIELALTAFSSALTYGTEIINELEKKRVVSLEDITNLSEKSKICNLSTIGFLIVFLWMIKQHKDYEKPEIPEKKKIIHLLLTCNFIGISSLSIFILFVRGI